MQIHLWCVVFGLAGSLASERAAEPMCGAPPAVQFATIAGPASEEYPTGTTVTYACQFGYVVSGSKKISECRLTYNEEDAEWTIPQISCKPRSCGDPGFVPNGYLVGSLFTFPNSVSFECNEGYQLIGNQKRYCQASGSWSGRLPRCESVACVPPGNPENGQVTYTSLEYGAELKYECNKGYHVQDDDPVYCTSEGTWSNPNMQCVEATCVVPKKPEHGTVEFIGSEVKPRAGTLAIFSCEGDRIPDGPTTSKCLDNGQWTFETPQCLEPCSVPPVPNGRIGRYVSRSFRNSAVFTEIAVGSRLKDGEKLFLHCNAGYSPLGSTTNWQERVACNGGKWSEEPHCEPKSCPLDPPETKNGMVDTVSLKHGGTVQYRCLPDFQKIKSGNVSCQFGEWKGVTPVCRDTRCSVDELVFPGLEKGSKQIYRDGEELEIKCNYRYSLAHGHAGRMKCENGLWKGPMPNCVAASCSEFPPRIDHGRADVKSVAHSSFAKYICDDEYVLVGSNEKVQCLFGEWSGQPPRCEDSKCLLEKFQHRTGVSPETESVTRSGDRLNVRCIEGYTPQAQLPMCHNGVWSRNTESPCKEKDCSVQWIANGDIQKHTLGPKKWNYWEFRYERDSIFSKLSYGSIPSRGEDLYLTCHNRYSVQGKGVDRVRLMCSEGRWTPDPVCLITGTPYIPTTRKPIPTTKMTQPTTSKPTTTTTHRTTTRRVSTSSALPFNEIIEKVEETTTTSSHPTEEPSTEAEECTCEYTLNDENIVAFTEGKVLDVYDRVRNGSLVNFRCKEVGFQHMVGQQEMTCESCRSWHPSEFPVCVNPKQGDAVIVYYDNVNVSMDGALEIRKGETARLSCIAVEEASYPEWSVPNNKGVVVVPELMERSEDYLYISHLDIENASIENEGSYTCAIEKYPETTVELRVIDSDIRCSEFAFEGEESVVANIEDTSVGSEATFSCRKYNQKMNGTNVLTCKRNGEWSGPLPQCEDIMCDELKGTDLMQISYTGNRKVGSFANFHCFAPGTPNGVSRTRCLDNGQWDHVTPTCRTPPCTAQSLFSVLPQKVEAEMEDVYNDTMPYNTTVRLTCSENMALRGNSVATCGKDGYWNIDEEIQCVSGCLPLTKPLESKLIIVPEKDVYSFGDIVTFSCMPGYYLNVENSKTMCFNNGRWTEDGLPECVDAVSFES